LRILPYITAAISSSL